MESEKKILVLFRCHNPLCEVLETPLEQPITRAALREMSQPESTSKFRCIKCGQMFPLSSQEKASNLKWLDEEAAIA